MSWSSKSEIYCVHCPCNIPRCERKAMENCWFIWCDTLWMSYIKFVRLCTLLGNKQRQKCVPWFCHCGELYYSYQIDSLFPGWQILYVKEKKSEHHHWKHFQAVITKSQFYCAKVTKQTFSMIHYHAHWTGGLIYGKRIESLNHWLSPVTWNDLDLSHGSGSHWPEWQH